MDSIQRTLQQPWIFGSGSVNSENFNKFFNTFKRSFSYQLRQLGAKDIEFSKGHFYLSGFYRIGEQWYYFSLSDVRHGFHQTDWQGRIELLIRTAKHNKDYTGGQNRYVAIKNKMFVDIARKFNLPEPEVKPRAKGKTTSDYVQEVLDKGYLVKTFTSVKKADLVAFRLIDKLKCEKKTISHSKYGRSIAKSYTETPELSYECCGTTKRAEFRLGKLSDKQLIESLKLPSGSEYRINPFTGDGATLEPLAVALHDKIKYWEGKNYDLFHQALLMFRTKWPDEYYTLLD